MFVNTNVAALNAWRNLENTQTDMTGVLQQLSSGYRINTAADDPAGLAISQQMQSQIGGLNQAYLNAQSGVSLLQTADGALGQIQNILQSMRSLASEAATGTMNSTDTQNLQTEMNQYAQEITQITNTTQFNNINLLAGGFQNQNLQVGANQGQSLAVSMNAADAATLGVAGLNVTATNTTGLLADTAGVTAVGISAATDTITGTSTQWSLGTFSGNSGAGSAAIVTAVAGNFSGTANDALNLQISSVTAGKTATVSYTDSANSSPVSVAFSDNGTNTTFTIKGMSFTVADAALGATSTYNISTLVSPTTTAFTDSGGGNNGLSGTVTGQITNGQSISLSTSAGGVLSFEAAPGAGSLVANTSVSSTYTVVAAGTVSGSPTATTAPVANFVTTAGGQAATVVNGQVTQNATVSSGINIETQANAQAALTIVDNAINTLSTERANVGAYQNRLQFASSDVQTTAQNLTAARAGIMDADMAQEMSNLSRDQVLEQSGVAMLAQANAVPQALLKLLP
jgi:flagellin